MVSEHVDLAWDGQLEWRPEENLWQGRYLPADCDVALAGSSASPSAELVSAAHAWTAQSAQLCAKAAQFISGRRIQGTSGDRELHIVHDPCTAQDIALVSLSLLNPEKPDAVRIEFVTGFPDGYFLYRLEFQAGVVVDGSFGFW